MPEPDRSPAVALPAGLAAQQRRVDDWTAGHRERSRQRLCSWEAA